MEKMTDTEFINKYSDIYADNSEKQMEFLEDISDSVKPIDDSEDKKLIADLEKKLEQANTEKELIKEKYINRFMGGDVIFKEKENEVVIDINDKDELNDGNYQLELFAYTNVNNNTLIETYNRVNISVVTEYHKGNKAILIHSQYEFIMKQIISIIIVCNSTYKT